MTPLIKLRNIILFDLKIILRFPCLSYLPFTSITLLFIRTSFIYVFLFNLLSFSLHSIYNSLFLLTLLSPITPFLCFIPSIPFNPITEGLNDFFSPFLSKYQRLLSVLPNIQQPKEKYPLTTSFGRSFPC